VENNYSTEPKNIPHSIAIEQAIISGILADAGAWDEVSVLIQESDFYSHRHRIIWSTCASLYKSGVAVDALTVSDHLKTHGMDVMMGGDAYLNDIIRDAPSTSINIEAYANRVRELSVLRQLLAASEVIAGSILAPDGKSASDLLNDAESAILGISTSRGGIGRQIPIHDSKTMLADALNRMDVALARKPGELSGTPTGSKAMDDWTDGFQAGDMVVIGARPSMGKTTYGLNIAEAALFGQNKPVVIFSMESPAWQIINRMLAMRSGVPMSTIQRGWFQGDEYTRVSDAMIDLKSRNLQVCDQSALSTNDMRAVLRRVNRQFGGIGLILLDYFQKSRSNRSDDRRTTNDILAEVSAELKGFGMEYDCPTIILSQLSKTCERRPNKRPMNSDLRDCGGIEQDADVIVMLYRDEVYNPNDDNVKGLAERIVTKNRNGPTGTLMSRFHGDIFRFSDVSSEVF